MRVVYRAVGSERPGLAASSSSSSGQLVVGSTAAAAAGGRLYLQFPISVTASPSVTLLSYGRIEFADSGETDLESGPGVELVLDDEFHALAGMDLVQLSGIVAQAADTTTSAEGAFFPELAKVLVESMPDLVFDAGQGTGSNLLQAGVAGIGDGSDDNDTAYHFYWSTDPHLTQVQVDREMPAIAVTGDQDRIYLETEAGAQAVRLLVRDLPAGTYYLYVVCPLTGTVPLARSRGIEVRHHPVIGGLTVGSSDVEVTLDSGGLLDLRGEATGQGQGAVAIGYAVVDHDDEVPVHLFCAERSDLDAASLILDGGRVTGLAGAAVVTPSQGLAEGQGSFLWDISAPPLVAAGDYYLYLAASDGQTQALRRSVRRVHLRHSPFLQLDPLDDEVLSGADTVVTGGRRPQRYLTLTWGRNGADGDGDLDSDARIGLYFSQVAAAGEGQSSGWSLPDGAGDLLTGVETRGGVIAEDLPEDPDEWQDNQYPWDLWAAGESGRTVPVAGVVHYLYGVIGDGQGRRLAQMNGGRPNDAGAKVVFLHPPALQVLQPAVDVTVTPGHRARVSWEDVDLDSDARIRVIATTVDHGLVSDFATVATGQARVVNSESGDPAAAVDPLRDLSEDDPVDWLDFSADGLTAGLYYLYVAITDQGRFDERSLAWRAYGRLQVEGEAQPVSGPRVAILPEVFTLGTDGARQSFSVAVDAGTDTVDLVQLVLQIDGRMLEVVDQDAGRTGVQPFAVGAAFSAARLVTNRVVDPGDGNLRLLLEYFEPTERSVPELDGVQSLVSFALQSLEQEGPVTVELVAEDATGLGSRLIRDGVEVAVPEPGALANGRLVVERAVVRGIVDLEGRGETDVALDVGLRPWSRYEDLQDPVFAAANDTDPLRAGVQMQLAADGGFELRQVPTGRLDLTVHRDGYLNGWAEGLELNPGQTLEGIRAATPGSLSGLILGGDVAGYRAGDGSSPPDNEVTLADWDYVAAYFAAGSAGDGRADITGDGVVDIHDLSLVGANYLRHGPRPVYRPITVDQRVVPLWLSVPAGPMAAGEEIEVALQVNDGDLTGIRAFEVELIADPEAWELIGERINDGLVQALTARRMEPSGWRTAAVLPGREADLAQTSIPATWRFRARVEGAALPRLGAAVLLDREDRPVTAWVSGSSGEGVQPREPLLGQNYPNPFNPGTSIPVVVPASADAGGALVRLEVYSLSGQRVRLLWDGPLGTGTHRLEWDGRDSAGRPVASGVYLCRLRVNRIEQVKRMVRIR
ncbi:MAG: hypothetical protein WDA75_21360 [Candidatus Latescibacterota bacterium]